MTPFDVFFNNNDNYTVGGWLILGTSVLVLLVLLFVTFVLFPLGLAIGYTMILHQLSSSKSSSKSTSSLKSSYFQRSKLLIGRVWHTRFQPKKHSFTYPIFMFALDLQEMEEKEEQNNDNNNIKKKLSLLWPLVQFQECNHLKNGEGKNNNNNNLSLSQRIFNLISERTNGKCTPTFETHRVVLMTHLTYYGYNFNPVSFYYIISKNTNENNDNDNDDNNHLTAMVGEVSNTPWLEMYPYVLHPQSIDKVQCRTNNHSTSNKNNNNKKTTQKYDYSFPKTFHVSPFMEMDYFYDWTLIGLPCSNNNKDSSSSSNSSTCLTVINSLRRRSPSPLPPPQQQSNAETGAAAAAIAAAGNNNNNNDDTTQESLLSSFPQQQNHDNDDKNNNNNNNNNNMSSSSPSETTSTLTTAFTAKLVIQTQQAITPINVAWQMIQFPIFCMIIQLWIHYEAAWLFIKGIVYVPHPHGTETLASKIIATIMIPFFAIRDRMQSSTSSSSTTSSSSSSSTTTTTTTSSSLKPKAE